MIITKPLRDWLAETSLPTIRGWMVKMSRAVRRLKMAKARRQSLQKLITTLANSEQNEALHLDAYGAGELCRYGAARGAIRAQGFEMTGIEVIAAERQRQIEKEGYTTEHDDRHTDEGLAQAAAWYALPAKIRALLEGFTQRKLCLWPFESNSFKPTPDDRVLELAKAGALIAAEIDRLTR